MAYKSLVPGLTIEDPRADRKKAVCIDRYYIGEQAVYITNFPHDRYIPYAAVQRVWYQASQHNVACGCGKGLAVFVVCVRYEDGSEEPRLQKYMLETQAEAEEMVKLISSRCPNL